MGGILGWGVTSRNVHCHLCVCIASYSFAFLGVFLFFGGLMSQKYLISHKNASSIAEKVKTTKSHELKAEVKKKQRWETNAARMRPEKSCYAKSYPRTHLECL